MDNYADKARKRWIYQNFQAVMVEDKKLQGRRGTESQQGVSRLWGCAGHPTFKSGREKGDEEKRMTLLLAITDFDEGFVDALQDVNNRRNSPREKAYGNGSRF